MRYLSVCSGIEAATVAWHPLGWQPVAFSEIDKFPSAVLSHHYPLVPNLGDMTRYKEWPDATVDVLVGGTPCQSFSVAGLRAGIADPRGNLMLTYLAIAERYRPRWLVWENVPGVLSSGAGRDFGAFLTGLGQLGYGYAYRVLDAQYFGLAQRRRRVFVVGSLGGWAAAAAVLFEPDCLRWDSAPSRTARESVASSTDGGSATGCEAESPMIPDVANPLTARMSKGINTTADEGQTAIVEPLPFDTTQITSVENRSAPAAGSPCHPLSASGHAPAIAYSVMPEAGQGADIKAIETDLAPSVVSTQSERGVHLVEHEVKAFTASDQSDSFAWERDIAPTVMAHRQSDTSNIQTGVRVGLTVRRLTPRECERLQGFPDDYTLITYKGTTAKDGPRYKALGNSMGVPCMRHIGERIAAVEQLLTEIKAGAA